MIAETEHNSAKRRDKSLRTEGEAETDFTKADAIRYPRLKPPNTNATTPNPEFLVLLTLRYWSDAYVRHVTDR